MKDKKRILPIFEVPVTRTASAISVRCVASYSTGPPEQFLVGIKTIFFDLSFRNTQSISLTAERLLR